MLLLHPCRLTTKFSLPNTSWDTRVLYDGLLCTRPFALNYHGYNKGAPLVPRYYPSTPSRGYFSRRSAWGQFTGTTRSGTNIALYFVHTRDNKKLKDLSIAIECRHLAADWTPRKYCFCGWNKFMFLMYQVGAGTSMFALGETLSLFCKTAACFKTVVSHRGSVRFCIRLIIINININHSRSSKSSM